MLRVPSLKPYSPRLLLGQEACQGGKAMLQLLLWQMAECGGSALLPVERLVMPPPGCYKGWVLDIGYCACVEHLYVLHPPWWHLR